MELSGITPYGDCGLGWKIAKAEADIKQAIHTNSLESGNHFHLVASKIGDTESRLNVQIGDTKASVLSKVGDAECRITEAVGNAECDILTKIGDTESRLQVRISDAERNLALNIVNAERDMQNRIAEARYEALKTSKDVADLIGYKTDDIKNQALAFERKTADNFSEVKTRMDDKIQVVLDKMAEYKLDEKNDELAEARAERYYNRSVSALNLLQAEVYNQKNLLNSVEQNQRFSSKTVQFGAGNVAIPTQTANQA